MDFVRADALPWLRQPQQRLREAQRAERLPHSSLLLSVPGLGAGYFANWLAALALCECESLPERPCGICPACSLLRSDSHPDVHVVRLAEDKKQISVDQVRELIASLALTSYRRGYKVGIIEGAENLNANGANAFLKTLEEPSDLTLLVMIARPTHRLPATIASRCLRLNLRPPARDEALAWLKAHGGLPDADWRAALALAAGAPLRAMEYHQGLAGLEEDMRNALRDMAADRVDVTLIADRWVKSHLELRLTWLENWITHRVRGYLGQALSNQSVERVRLPGALLKPKIRGLFELLDGARDLRRLAATGINQQLALEALLLGGRAALTP